jgi:hypothetical protein
LGWLLYCFSSSVPMLFAANIILGLGMGFMEAPVLTYLGETCQPQVRDHVTSFLGTLQRPKDNGISNNHNTFCRPSCNFLYPTIIKTFSS